jgi:hypothetical protein
MATTSVPRSAATGDYATYPVEEPSGWLFFAGTVLGLAGIMRILDSIWAFGYNGVLPNQLRDSLLGSDLTTYAWLWLGVGAVLLVSSFMILVRSQFARWIGLIAATVAAVTAMAWMPYYPIWTLVYVGMAVLTFYALAAHGGRTAR